MCVFATLATVDAPPADYPEMARMMQLTGTPVIRVVIDEAGSLQNAAVLMSSGNKWLDAEAIRAARVARYVSATERCRPVPSVAKLRVDFNG